MARSEGGSQKNALRAAVSSPRAKVVAIVGGLSALGGTLAGGVAALIAASVLTPTEPMSAASIAGMAASYGVIAGVAGSVLGTVVGFGALRRVPLGRLVLCTNVGLAAGLTTAWLGGPWAWHHMGLLGLAGFTAGAVVAGVTSLGSRGSRSELQFDSGSESGTIASNPQRAIPTSSPGERVQSTAQMADRVKRNVPPER